MPADRNIQDRGVSAEPELLSYRESKGVININGMAIKILIKAAAIMMK